MDRLYQSRQLGLAGLVVRDLLQCGGKPVRCKSLELKNDFCNLRVIFEFHIDRPFLDLNRKNGAALPVNAAGRKQDAIVVCTPTQFGVKQVFR